MIEHADVARERAHWHASEATSILTTSPHAESAVARALAHAQTALALVAVAAHLPYSRQNTLPPERPSTLPVSR